jgi:hypothetical protein
LADVHFIVVDVKLKQHFDGINVCFYTRFHVATSRKDDQLMGALAPPQYPADLIAITLHGSQ